MPWPHGEGNWQVREMTISTGSSPPGWMLDPSVAIGKVRRPAVFPGYRRNQMVGRKEQDREKQDHADPVIGGNTSGSTEPSSPWRGSPSTSDRHPPESDGLCSMHVVLNEQFKVMKNVSAMLVISQPSGPKSPRLARPNLFGFGGSAPCTAQSWQALRFKLVA